MGYVARSPVSDGPSVVASPVSSNTIAVVTTSLAGRSQGGGAEGADHERQKRHEREGRPLQEDRRRREREASSEQRQPPVAAAREASIKDTEHGLSGGAGHRADGRARRER